MGRECRGWGNGLVSSRTNPGWLVYICRESRRQTKSIKLGEQKSISITMSFRRTIYCCRLSVPTLKKKVGGGKIYALPGLISKRRDEIGKTLACMWK